MFVGAGGDQFAGSNPTNSHVLIGAFAGFAATANNFRSFNSVNFFHLEFPYFRFILCNHLH